MRWLVVGASVWVALCLAVFGAWLTAAACLLPAVAAWRRKPWVALLGGVALLTAVPEYIARVRQLGERRADLSVRDEAGVWLLNVGVAAGGTLAGFPEVALETLLLAVPDGDGVRTFRSSFPRGTPKLDAVVDGWHAACARGQRSFGPRKTPLGYHGGHADWRRALALDPPTLSATADADCTLSITVSVPIDYPNASFLVLAPTPLGPLGIDEGLFDALEDDGWLFPYEARWVWTEPAPGPSGG